MFMAEWARRIAAQDQAFATQTGGDVHEYLVHKLFYTLKTIRGPRQWGWKFLNAGASQCVYCFVQADGSPTQLLPLGESRSAQECWWPCLVLWEEKQAVLPFILPCAGMGERTAMGCPCEPCSVAHVSGPACCTASCRLALESGCVQNVNRPRQIM